MTVDDYCAAKVTEDIAETDPRRVRQAIEGSLIRSYFNLAIGQADSAAGYELLAEKILARYHRETEKQKERIPLPDMPELKKEALRQFDSTYNPMLVAQLHTKLGLPLPTNAAPANASPKQD